MFKGLIEKVIDFNGQALRNIPSIVLSEDLLDDLSADPQVWAFGEAAVAETSEGHASAHPVIMRPFEYGSQ